MYVVAQEGMNKTHGVEERRFIRHTHKLLNIPQDLPQYKAPHAHKTSTYAGKSLHTHAHTHKRSKWADKRMYNITTAALWELKRKHDSTVYQQRTMSQHI